MSVMKRISTERITNPELTGRRDNPELAAMYAIWQASLKPKSTPRKEDVCSDEPPFDYP